MKKISVEDSVLIKNINKDFEKGKITLLRLKMEQGKIMAKYHKKTL